MEAKFESIGVQEFAGMFPDKKSCLEYLVKLKWQDGYKCRKCGGGNYCSGNREFERQCTKCHYCESPTAGTLFHRIRFPLTKAFWIIYFLSTCKKGMASTELARKVQLRQKTCWAFKQKVMAAMESSGKHPLKGSITVDEFVVGQEEEGVRGRKNSSKKLVVIGVEEKGGGASRMYARVIKSASAENLGGFMRDNIDPKAHINTDGWTGYTPLHKDFENLKQTKSEKKGKNFNLVHRVIMGFKAWLRGIHTHAENLQKYLDEYDYRFNRSQMKRGIFENLMRRMIRHQPKPYKPVID